MCFLPIILFLLIPLFLYGMFKFSDLIFSFPFLIFQYLIYHPYRSHSREPRIDGKSLSYRGYRIPNVLPCNRVIICIPADAALGLLILIPDVCQCCTHFLHVGLITAHRIGKLPNLWYRFSLPRRWKSKPFLTNRISSANLESVTAIFCSSSILCFKPDSVTWNFPLLFFPILYSIHEPS